MPWLSLFNSLLKVTAYVAQIVRNKQLMDAGAAQATLNGLEDVQKKVQAAIAAGNAAAADGVSDPFQQKTDD